MGVWVYGLTNSSATHALGSSAPRATIVSHYWIIAIILIVIIAVVILAITFFMRQLVLLV